MIIIIPHKHENFTPIEQIEEPYMQNPEEDDTIGTRKSKRQRTVKSFGDDYIVYLVDVMRTSLPLIQPHQLHNKVR